MFKVGDRVVHDDSHEPSLANKIGTVMAIDGRDILVKFEDWHDGHDGYSALGDSHKGADNMWFCSPFSIEKVENAEQTEYANRLFVVSDQMNDLMEKLIEANRVVKSMELDELTSLHEITQEYISALDIELSYIDGLRDGIKKGW